MCSDWVELHEEIFRLQQLFTNNSSFIVIMKCSVQLEEESVKDKVDLLYRGQIRIQK